MTNLAGRASIHYIKYLAGIDPPHTQTTVREQEMLKKYATDKKCAVEIGIYEGVNTVLIANCLNEQGILYGIDPFYKGKMGISYPKGIAVRQIKKTNLVHKIRIIEKLSFEAYSDVPDGIEFIFFDGDHSYEGIKKDWELWSGKVAQNGIVALHDTSVPEHDPNVAKLGSYIFFNEYIFKDSRFEHIDQVDSLNILTRKDNP